DEAECRQADPRHGDGQADARQGLEEAPPRVEALEAEAPAPQGGAHLARGREAYPAPRSLPLIAGPPAPARPAPGGHGTLSRPERRPTGRARPLAAFRAARSSPPRADAYRLPRRRRAVGVLRPSRLRERVGLGRVTDGSPPPGPKRGEKE